MRGLNFCIFFSRKLVWCPVYKAASTNWISILPTLSNFRSSQIKILKRRFIQPNELAPIVAKHMGLTQFRKYVSANDPVKFLIVRHPFDRLLSAYRDKLVSESFSCSSFSAVFLNLLGFKSRLTQNFYITVPVTIF